MSYPEDSYAFEESDNELIEQNHQQHDDAAASATIRSSAVTIRRDRYHSSMIDSNRAESSRRYHTSNRTARKYLLTNHPSSESREDTSKPTKMLMEQPSPHSMSGISLGTERSKQRKRPNPHDKLQEVPSKKRKAIQTRLDSFLKSVPPIEASCSTENSMGNHQSSSSEPPNQQMALQETQKKTSSKRPRPETVLVLEETPAKKRKKIMLPETESGNKENNSLNSQGLVAATAGQAQHQVESDHSTTAACYGENSTNSASENDPQVPPQTGNKRKRKQQTSKKQQSTQQSSSSSQATQESNESESELSPGRQRRSRCGECPGCSTWKQQNDCGECKNCKDKKKFGGPGRKRKACEKRPQCDKLKPLPKSKGQNKKAPKQTTGAHEQATPSANSHREELKKRLKDVLRVMRMQRTRTHTILNCVFMGSPRMGKSSLLKRLAGKKVKPGQHSTGVAKGILKVKIEKPTLEKIKVSRKGWQVLNSNEETANIIVQATLQEGTEPEVNTIHGQSVPEFMMHSSTQQETESGRFTNREPSEENASSAPNPPHNPHTSSGPNPVEMCREAVRQHGNLPSEEEVENSSTVYLTDTGGQMEFEELLPVLVSGPSIFFLVFRLDVDLDERYTVQYDDPNGRSSEQYKSSFTVKDSLLRSLASIASMGEVTCNCQTGKHKLAPKVFIVGTHKDKVTQDKVDKIDKQLQELIKQTAYRRNVQFAKKSCLLWAVDNLSEDAENAQNFQRIRDAVERCGRRRCHAVAARVSWLIFSRFLDSLNSMAISYDECFERAKQCFIDVKDELNDALQFLHKKGLLRYFNLDKLKDVVIVDSKLLFDRITEMIIRTFTFEGADTCDHEGFEKKGIFHSRVFEELSNKSNDKVLTAEKLLVLLEHLHIITAIRTTENGTEYFMPCVLQCSEPDAPRRRSSRLNISPLVFGFECGYVPKGVYGALVAYLLSNKMTSDLHWELDTNKLFRDQVTILVGQYDTIQLRFWPSHFEIEVTSTNLGKDHLASACSEIRHCFEEALYTVTRDLHYSDAKHYLATYCQEACTRSNSTLHLAKLIQERSGNRYLKCMLTKTRVELPTDFAVWFSKPRITQNMERAPTSSLGSRASRNGCDQPKLQELIKFQSNQGDINIPAQIGAKYRRFGVLLLEDSIGAKVASIELKHQKDSEEINLEILREWLNGRGRHPVTWKTLCDALEDTGLRTLAGSIRAVII